MDDLVINEHISVPDAELHYEFSTTGGPGGQHANRSATGVTLSFDVTSSQAFPEPMKQRVLSALQDRVAQGRFRDGTIVVVAEATRSQWRNRQAARRRLAEIIEEALRPPPRPRKRTQPSRAARERRLAAKRHRSETKRMRRPPRYD